MIEQPVEKKKRRSKAQVIVTKPEVIVTKPAKKPRTVKPTPVPTVEFIVTPVEPTPVPTTEFIVESTPVSKEAKDGFTPIPLGLGNWDQYETIPTLAAPKKSWWQRFLDIFR